MVVTRTFAAAPTARWRAGALARWRVYHARERHVDLAPRTSTDDSPEETA